MIGDLTLDHFYQTKKKNLDVKERKNSKNIMHGR